MAEGYRRSVHCALAGIDVNTFKSLAQRGQLPNGASLKRSYSFADTFTLMIALRLRNVFGISRDVAAQIAGFVSPIALLEHWQAISFLNPQSLAEKYRRPAARPYISARRRRDWSSCSRTRDISWP